jgi:hypothetical protein
MGVKSVRVRKKVALRALSLPTTALSQKHAAEQGQEARRRRGLSHTRSVALVAHVDRPSVRRVAIGAVSYELKRRDMSCRIDTIQ